MPNRHRRKLSTTTSAVAALVVATPCAYFAVYAATRGLSPDPAPEHHAFVPAATIADLPGDIISAVSQGLSQFGVNLPPVPTGLTGGATTTPGLVSPGLVSPDGLVPSAAGPALTDPSLTNPALTNPALTSPVGAIPGLTNPTGAIPGLTSPTGAIPGLTSPAGATPALTTPVLTGPSEVPITTPIGLDPGADGTYPILGDPTLGAAPQAASGGGGLIGELMNTANQLGAGQVIDLIKGVVMPSIMQAAQNGGGALPGLPADAAAAVPAPTA